MERMSDTQYLKDYLRDHEVKPSTIRINVLDYLLKNRVHPTADDIYREISKKIPTLSKTSIYNTVDLFTEKNIIHVIGTGGKENRYDINLIIHGHFVCRICDKIYDFDIEPIDFNKEQLDGFIIEEQDVLFKGICRECTSQ